MNVDDGIKVGRSYATPTELERVFFWTGVRPRISAARCAQLISEGRLKPFVSDGPSDYGARFLLCVVYGNKAGSFLRSIEHHAIRHDVEHWLGESSGITRDQSNAAFRDGIQRDGFLFGANVSYSFIDRFSGSKTAPWRWGFGWTGLDSTHPK